MGGLGAAGAMKPRLSEMSIVVAILALAGCHAAPAERERAGDAGYVYQLREAGDAGALARFDAGERPTLTVVAGAPGGRGDLDGVGVAARVGLVGGMVRVDDAIVFADEGNGSIRRFVPKTGAVETLARLPPGVDGRPALPAFVAEGGKSRVFVSDRSGHVIYALNLRTQALTLLAGKMATRGDTDGDASQALFDSPTGLAFDGDHTLFVADAGGRHIRSIDVASGIVSTLTPSFLQVWGLCFDKDALYATDNLSESILRINPKTGESTLVAGSNRFGHQGATDGPAEAARFREPRGLTCGRASFLVADRGNSTVRRVDKLTHAVTTLAGHGEVFGFRDGYAKDAMFVDVQSVLEWDHTVYVGDDATIRALSLRDSIVRTVAGAANQQEFSHGDRSALVHGDRRALGHGDRSALVQPEGVAVSLADHTAYVATCLTASVERIDLDTLAMTAFAGGTRKGFVDGSGDDAVFGCVSAIVYDGHGNLFVGDRDNHAVRGIRTDTRQVTTIAGTPSRCGNDDGPLETATFCDPSGLAVGDGALFVADVSTSTIRRIDLREYAVTTLAGTPFVRGHADGPGKTATFAAPSSLVYRDGVLFVADRENHVVRRVDARSGEVTTFAGATGDKGTADGPRTEALFTRPRAVALLGEDGLLVIDRLSVRRLSLSDGAVVRLFDAGPGLRLGPGTPLMLEPVAAVELSPGEALIVDRLENTLLRAQY